MVYHQSTTPHLRRLHGLLHQVGATRRHTERNWLDIGDWWHTILKHDCSYSLRRRSFVDKVLQTKICRLQWYMRRIFTTSAVKVCFARGDIQVEQCSTPSEVSSAKTALICYFGSEDWNGQWYGNTALIITVVSEVPLGVNIDIPLAT